MGNWEEWLFQCTSCGKQKKTRLKEYDVDTGLVDYFAEDLNRSIEANWTCDACGSKEFKKLGRALFGTTEYREDRRKSSGGVRGQGG